MPPFPDWRLLRKMSRSRALESPSCWFRGNSGGLLELFSLHPAIYIKGVNATNRNIAKALESQALFTLRPRREEGSVRSRNSKRPPASTWPCEMPGAAISSSMSRRLSRADSKLPNTSSVPCRTCTSSRNTRNSGREPSGVSPTRSRPHSKKLDPFPQFKATAKLSEFLEARFSQSF